MPDHTDPDRWIEAQQLDQITGVTDDRCQDRCKDLLSWFTFETRGLMDPDEAHDVLDMLLNRLASDQSVGPAPAERPAPVGSWWRTPDGEVMQVSGDYLDGPGDQIITYTNYCQDGTVAQGKWGGKEFAAAYARIEAHEVPDWVEVAW